MTAPAYTLHHGDAQMHFGFADPDPVVCALISTTISITTWEGLPSVVAGASAEQLRRALDLLPDEVRKGRAPIFEHCLRKMETHHVQTTA